MTKARLFYLKKGAAMVLRCFQAMHSATVRLLFWLIWNVIYLFRKEPKDFHGYMTKTIRTMWPWRKFYPNAWHNKDGHFWEIWLENESAYTETGRQLKADLFIAQDESRIVGFRVGDSELNV